MGFTKKLVVGTLFMSCIYSSVYAEDAADATSWVNWFYRKMFFGENWAPSSASEENILIMCIDELQCEIAKIQEKKNYLYSEIDFLEISIAKLTNAKFNIIIDYEKTQKEYEEKKNELECIRNDCRLKEMEIAKRYHEIEISFENQKHEFERLKDEVISRKDQLRSSWAEFLQTTASGNKLFSQLIAGVAAQQLLLTEQAAYGSSLSEKKMRSSRARFLMVEMIGKIVL